MRDIEWSGPWPRGRVDFTGQDGNSADFDVYSLTKKGRVYDVRLNYHNGFIECDCEDCVCRKKKAPINNYKNMGCKHIRRVCALLEVTGVFNNGE